MRYFGIMRSILYKPFLVGLYNVYRKYLEGQITKATIPQHIGIILDGNRRWAFMHTYPRRLGHRRGADNAEHILEWCHDIGIKAVTLYALSTENLDRPQEELDELFEVIEEKLKDLLDDERIHRYKIKVKSLGNSDYLTEEIRETLNNLEEKTKNYSNHFLNIAIAYGGRTEILDVIRKITEEVNKGRLEINDIDIKTVDKYLYTAHLPNPEPELIIRTSGEERLSGFLLWQGAYSELVFLDVYWPDFRKIDLMRAIRTYQNRLRRFGQ
ncbi:MAG TPA: polyprenyl diphosphate synthase [Nitrososphaerales archaeon]|nr:polyprenyl diphosphate synthase [Nitrososphaerales archaeon]